MEDDETFAGAFCCGACLSRSGGVALRARAPVVALGMGSGCFARLSFLLKKSSIVHVFVFVCDCVATKNDAGGKFVPSHADMGYASI